MLPAEVDQNLDLLGQFRIINKHKYLNKNKKANKLWEKHLKTWALILTRNKIKSSSYKVTTLEIPQQEPQQRLHT